MNNKPLEREPMNNEPVERELIDRMRARLEALTKANAAPRCGARSKFRWQDVVTLRPILERPLCRRASTSGKAKDAGPRCR